MVTSVVAPATAVPAPATPADQSWPRPRLWSSAEFYAMLDLGLFRDQHVELVEGEVLIVPSQKNTHLAAITLTEDALRAAFGPGYWVRVQGSLDLSPLSVLDPDLAVVAGSPRGSGPANPTTALLVVEVSETTLAYDRGRKAAVYAQAGIADYWVINLETRRLEVHCSPTRDASRTHGFGYADVQTFGPGDAVTPLAAPHARVAVAELLP